MNLNEMTIEQLEKLHKETGRNTVIRDGIARPGFEKRKVAPVQQSRVLTTAAKEKLAEAVADLSSVELMELLSNIDWRIRFQSVISDMESMESQLLGIKATIGA